ncbi:MAG: hypothetical protein ABIH23_15990 [bacterium]
MKPLSKTIIFSTFLPFLLCVSRASADPADDYKQAARHMTVAERLELAKETVENSQDEAALSEAVSDLANFSLTPERNEAALAKVETLIRKCKRDSDLFGQTRLAKARILARMGQKDEAYGMFRQAVLEKSHKSTYGEFFTSLWENGDYALSGIEDYHRHTGDEYSKEIREFHGSHGNLIKMHTRLWVMKLTHPEYSAMDSAFPQLQESQRRPLAKPIAKALCLAVDQRYEEAIEELNGIEKLLASGKAPKSEFDESKDLRFYLASVLFFEGRDFDAMRTAFREYMDRNEDNRLEVLERALNLAYAMEFKEWDFRKVPELTGFIINSEYMTDETIKSQFSEDKIASLLNIHLRGLWYQGKSEEAERLALEIVDRYYPQTLEGANAAFGLALYSAYLHKDRDAMLRRLNDILEKSPYPQIVPHVKACLAGSAFACGDIERALALSQDVLDQIGPHWQGSFRQCRESMLRLQEKIERGEVGTGIRDRRFVP